MHIDLKGAAPASLRADVCVIGAGAAGITMARRLIGHGLSVLLIESGGLDHEAETARLNEGEIVGQDYYPLDQARLRFFGGTTAIWGGRCAELDPIDFARRSWVPHSGWPIGPEDIAPYYAEARAALGLPAAPPRAEALAASGVPLPAFDPDRVRTALWSFDERFGRFTAESCRDLFEHPRCTIVTHATVREIVALPSASAIDHLDIATPGGRQLKARGQAYVLAAGGIENPRLLLASRSMVPAGLGNGHDLVGRFFMEHPHARGGRIVDGAAWTLLRAFGRKHRLGAATVAALLRPGEAAQERLGLLNTSLTIAGRRPTTLNESIGMRAYQKLKHDMAPTRGGRALWMRTKMLTHAVLSVTEPARPWLLNRLGRLDVALVVRAEQAPNSESRVTLSRDETDAAGVPRARLDWRTSPLDVDSVAGLVSLLGAELQRLGLGRVEAAPWLSDPARAWRTDALISAHPIGGYHHIGTTRMAADPRRGVTDGEGRVHGIANLYVAGSSLFPTSGWANPTLSIVALAMRTGDCLHQALTRWQRPLIATEPMRRAG